MSYSDKNNFISSPSICNVQLPLAIKPVKDTYARRTTVSRIGFWYYYDSSETLLHERASVITGLDYWTGLYWTLISMH